MSEKSGLIVGVTLVVAVVGGLFIWGWSAHDSRSTVPIPTSDEGTQTNNPNAIANRWEWENFTDDEPEREPTADAEDAEAEEPPPSGEVPFDVVQIYNLLESIQINANGRVVPDQAAKYALEKAFEDLGPDITPETMAELQELIRIGLPGEPGEEAARILEDYYRFRQAEEDFNQEMEDQLSETENQPPSLERYEERMELRRRYLGEDIADQLFALENAQARHTFATVEIQQNDDLTDEEKQAELAALQEKLNDRLVALGEMTPEQVAGEEVERLRENGASDAEIHATREELLGPAKAQELAEADREEAQWQSRFDQFWEERQQVMQASMDEAEKERQIEQLLDQHFSADERERAQLSTLNRETRERE